MTKDKTTITAPTLIILLLFFFSGVSGLIYEVLWTRMFSLVLGTTVYAVATVLGVYMGGLALGSWFFGRLADKPKANGFRLYGWLEAGVGIYAFMLPMLMTLSDEIYKAAWPILSDSFLGLMALRLLMAIVLLIIPTTLMGGTLPALSRFLVRRTDRTGIEIGTLYAINTLGAVIGCFLTGFFLIEFLGVRLTLTTAAILNLIVAGSALYFSRSKPQIDIESPPEPGESKKVRRVIGEFSPNQVKAVLWLFALSGFSSLALEVLWTRSLMYFVNIDTWAFTAMLCAFLTGIGLGSLIMARLVVKIRKPLKVLAAIELLIGITAGLSIPLFDLLYGTRNLWFMQGFEGNVLFWQIIHKLLDSFLIMIVPTLLMGAAFPLVCRIYVGAGKDIGRGTGTLYALNTAGAIIGSSVAGFILLPLLGTLQSSILVSASFYALIGLILLVISAEKKAVKLQAKVLAIVGFALIIFVNVRFSGQPIITLSQFFKNDPGTFSLAYFKEGPDASIAVLEKPNGLRELNINGQSTAFTNYMDMQVHRMLSHLPVLLHPDPKKILVVGFGMGSTVWGCCQYDSVERVDCVELLHAEKETAPYFEEVNHGVLDHPKLNFIVGDGRNYILGTREKYDVISFNAIHPRYSANLYTYDFYQMCREKMTEDGIICAWMTQNALADVEWKMLCRSLSEVFPHTSLWYCNPQHFCLIGSMQPLVVDFEAWQKRMAEEDVAADLRDSNLDDPYVLLTRYMFADNKLREYLADYPLNTDDKPLVEFARVSVRSEKDIIEELINLKEDVDQALKRPLSDEISAMLSAYNQSSVWMMHGQTETWYPTSPFAAEIAHRKALLYAPDNQDVRHNLGFSDRIKSLVQQTLDDDPGYQRALVDMARIYMELGDFETAEAYLVHALAKDPGSPGAQTRMGLLWLIQGKNEEASGILSRAAQMSQSPHPVIAYAYFEALIRAGINVDGAVENQQRIIQQVPGVDEVFDLMEQTMKLLRKRRL